MYIYVFNNGEHVIKLKTCKDLSNSYYTIQCEYNLVNKNLGG